jgi:hypothetical protein
MNNLISNIKKYLLAVLFPTAIFVILALSSLKDIEKAFVRFRFGRDITLYLRRSTDYLTYLGCAYTATGDKKFLEQFNSHLKERENYFNNEVFISKILTKEELKEFRVGLDISNELAKEVEAPAFEKMDSKAFFSDKYLDYKKRIYLSKEKFRDLINNSSEKIIHSETELLNVYLYSLVGIVLFLVYLIKHDHPTPIKKKLIKRKKK